MKTRNFGALPSHGDLRDIAYAAPTVLKGVKIPRRYSLRSEQSDVINQNGLPICVACAICSIAESRPFFFPYNLSECEIYAKRYNKPQEGMELRDALKIMQHQGTCTDGCFPLSNKCVRPICDTKRIQEECKMFRIGTYMRVFHSIPDVLYANKLPMFACVPVYSNWSDDGNIPMPTRDSKMISYHAVVITGYNLDTACIEFKNSWGRNWGDNGYGYLPLHYPIIEAWIVKPREPAPPIPPHTFNAEIISTELAGRTFFGMRINLDVRVSNYCCLTAQPGFLNRLGHPLQPGTNRVSIYVPFKYGSETPITINFKDKHGNIIRYKSTLIVKLSEEIKKWEQA